MDRDFPIEGTRHVLKSRDLFEFFFSADEQRSMKKPFSTDMLVVNVSVLNIIYTCYLLHVMGKNTWKLPTLNTSCLDGNSNSLDIIMF